MHLLTTFPCCLQSLKMKTFKAKPVSNGKDFLKQEVVQEWLKTLLPTWVQWRHGSYTPHGAGTRRSTAHVSWEPRSSCCQLCAHCMVRNESCNARLGQSQVVSEGHGFAYGTLRLQLLSLFILFSFETRFHHIVLELFRPGLALNSQRPTGIPAKVLGSKASSTTPGSGPKS